MHRLCFFFFSCLGVEIDPDSNNPRRKGRSDTRFHYECADTLYPRYRRLLLSVSMTLELPVRLSGILGAEGYSTLAAISCHMLPVRKQNRGNTYFE